MALMVHSVRRFLQRIFKLTGTSGDDTFSATSTTLNPTDSLDGGATQYVQIDAKHF
jgi:hypothetical protein